jgi:hypothetical protein
VEIMGVGESHRVELTADDRQRMRRLSEEVRGRLEEMALITARTLGIGLTSDTVRKFVPAKSVFDEAHVV